MAKLSTLFIIVACIVLFIVVGFTMGVVLGTQRAKTSSLGNIPIYVSPLEDVSVRDTLGDQFGSADSGTLYAVVTHIDGTTTPSSGSQALSVGAPTVLHGIQTSDVLRVSRNPKVPAPGDTNSGGATTLTYTFDNTNVTAVTVYPDRIIPNTESFALEVRNMTPNPVVVTSAFGGGDSSSVWSLQPEPIGTQGAEKYTVFPSQVLKVLVGDRKIYTFMVQESWVNLLTVTASGINTGTLT